MDFFALATTLMMSVLLGVASTLAVLWAAIAGFERIARVARGMKSLGQTEAAGTSATLTAS